MGGGGESSDWIFHEANLNAPFSIGRQIAGRCDRQSSDRAHCGPFSFYNDRLRNSSAMNDPIKGIWERVAHLTAISSPWFTFLLERWRNEKGIELEYWRTFSTQSSYI